MLSRDKLFQFRSRVKKGDDLLTRDQQLAVIDHGIEALVEMAGGASVSEQRNQLKERERQLGLALADIREDIGRVFDPPDWCHCPPGLECAPSAEEKEKRSLKAIYMVDAAFEMLKAKSPQWQREWSWYTPRIDEEFSPK